MKENTNLLFKIPLIRYEVIGRKFTGDQSHVKREFKFAVNDAKDVVGFNHRSAIALLNGFGYIGIRKVFIPLIAVLFSMSAMGQTPLRWSYRFGNVPMAAYISPDSVLHVKDSVEAGKLILKTLRRLEDEKQRLFDTVVKLDKEQNELEKTRLELLALWKEVYKMNETTERSRYLILNVIIPSIKEKLK